MVFKDLEHLLSGFKVPSTPQSVVEDMIVNDTLDDIIEEQPTMEQTTEKLKAT